MLTRVIAMIFICGTLHAQVTEQWAKRYNGAANSSDKANRIALTSIGKIVVTGYSTENTSGYLDVCTIMYDQSGNRLWKANYDSPYHRNDEAYDMAIDANDNIILGGKSGHFIGDFWKALIIKYNPSGVFQWAVLDSGGIVMSMISGVIVRTDANGNIYVGERYGTIPGISGAVVKYSPQGVFLWKKSFIGSVKDIIVLQEGDFYVSISSGSYFLYKCNANGTPIWCDSLKIPCYPGGESPCKLAKDFTDNIFLSSTNYMTERTHILKISPSGEILWGDSSLVGNNGLCILTDANGNAYTGGYFHNGMDIDYIVIKYSGSGNLLWSETFNSGSSKNDIITGIAINKTGNIVATGYNYMNYYNYARSDFLTVKFGTNGGIVWAKTYNGTNDSADMAYDIAADTSGNIFVTGTSNGVSTGMDILTIKYNEPIGIREIGAEIPEEYLLEQNYPNPFNPKTIINYQLPINNYVTLKIYDLTGKEIATLVNEEQKPGKYETEFDGSNLPSGIYYYQLSVDNKPLAAKKMVLIK
jgi:hypothetical protein